MVRFFCVDMAYVPLRDALSRVLGGSESTLDFSAKALVWNESKQRSVSQTPGISSARFASSHSGISLPSWVHWVRRPEAKREREKKSSRPSLIATVETPRFSAWGACNKRQNSSRQHQFRASFSHFPSLTPPRLVSAWVQPHRNCDAVNGNRPGVLVRLSLPGKRIGDRGAAALASALAGVRSVDLRSNNIGDTGTVAIASALRDATAAEAAAAPAAAATTPVSNGGASESPCVLESLSLAGNRIGDAGAEALSVLLEEGGKGAREAGKTSTSSGFENKAGRASPVPSAPTTSPAGFRYLGWLSIAGNPGVSDDSKERLLRAGSNRGRLLRSGDGRDNDPPAMVIIV